MTLRKWTSPVRLVVLLGAVLCVVLWHSPLFGAEKPVIIAPPAIDNPKAAGPAQTAVLAGGGFWGVQGVFEHVRGVQKVIAGYAGGDKSTAGGRDLLAVGRPYGVFHPRHHSLSDHHPVSGCGCSKFRPARKHNFPFHLFSASYYFADRHWPALVDDP